ncbi:hypothetical protein ACEPAI_8802 [Sanghuangporus weigelae]
MSSVSQNTPMSGLSALFSLSDAAATVPPMPVSNSEPTKTSKDLKDLASGKHGSHALKHRRLSSTGQTRRRMSDARDAVSRPAPANLSAASALASLSSLSLTPSGISSVNSSGHNLHSHPQTRGRSQANINHQATFAPSSAGSNGVGILASSVPETSYAQDMASSVADDIEVDVEDFDDGASVADSVATRATDKKAGKSVKVKKRGTIFQCESCSKVYRHPSCLVKHRWEHTPQWREASKFMLSKHQQVQVLEAAAILYTGSSLPDDKSYWPSYVSNGVVPPPSADNVSGMDSLTSSSGARSTNKISSSLPVVHHPVSSSVPVRAQAPRLDRPRSGSVTSTASGGPRMRDFTVPSGITQIRPGLLAHPTAPVVPTGRLGGTISPYADEELDINGDKEQVDALAPIQVISPSKPQPMSVPQGNVAGNRGNFVEYRENGSVLSVSGFSVESGSVSTSLAHFGGWSLPRSDMRSSSVARSYSGSRSDDEEDALHSARGGSEDEIDVDVDVADAHRDRFDVETSYGSYSGTGFGFAHRKTEPVIKEEADDSWEEMDMEVSFVRF